MSFSSDDEPTVLPTPTLQSEGADGGVPRLTPGQALGPYRIERLLGRGGMGEVYEAEHRDHGRRVALKVLNQRLAGAGDRARFLREGQLAASLNHPNAVYVFGSEDIDGTPVTAMELVAGGTLKDVVDRDGPMAPPAAVDAILQVVAGLDAALACGILHRDVKPSNCFVGPDGAVKVGDFGLSIPVLAPEVTQPGETATFQGTPQFASPEQLRGQPLDVRADIYAVGATLYYLLTGHPPFEDRELMALLTRVATESPRPPRRPGAAIPPGLSAVVVRCLAKDPADRPASYAELDASLRSFGSAVPSPANLGLRAAAGLIDWLLIAAALAPLAVTPVLELTGDNSINASITYTGPRDLKSSPWVTLAVGLVTAAYYGLLEGRWGRSLGKQICGLKIVTRRGEPVGLARATLRAILFTAPYWLMFASKGVAEVTAPGEGLAAAGWARSAAGWAVNALNLLIFTSMRRRNGFGAWHDLATDTRVVVAGRRSHRAAIDATPAPARIREETDQGTRVGPYTLVGPVGETAGGTMMLGVDPALKRDVWIHVLPPGVPAVGAPRASLGRPGRLRWLNGRRAEDEAWDAYEAPDGAPLVRMCESPRPWRVVQHWFDDLARELAAASADGSTPALALDRVWITRGGRARLLDFPAPGSGDAAVPEGGTALADPQRFIARVMTHALGAARERPGARTTAWELLPRLAQATLDTLEHTGFPSLAAVAERAAELREGADHVSRARRAASIVLANIPLIFALIALSIGLPTAVRLLETEFLTMSKALVAIRILDGKTDQESVRTREALERYAVGRFSVTLADERTWRDPRTSGLLTPLKPIASRILSGRRAATDDERRAAEAHLGDPVSLRSQAIRIAIVLPAVVLLLSAVAAVLSAFLFRGGWLLRSLGLAVVSARGRDVSRTRAALRAAVAWSPVLLLWLYVWASTRGGSDVLDALSNWPVPAAASAVALAGSAWAIHHPARGAAERLTGTYIVPR